VSERYEVPPERLGRWLDRWAEAHGGVAVVARDGDGLVLTGGDGAALGVEPPFAPVADPSVAGLLAHVEMERRVGVLLVRLGAHAAGVFEGARLVASKVDRRLVHARHRKGGSSSGRFARRRENEATDSLRAAAEVAARVLVGEAEAGRLDAVVLGGDRRALERVMEDRWLEPLRGLVVDRVIEVPEPRLEVLRGTPELFLATVLRVG
jgi:hypothetical protein